MKKVVNCYYVHKSNINELYNSIPTNLLAAVMGIFQEGSILYDIPFEVVKVDVHRRTISLIQSPTFDIFEEPIVGDSYCYNIDTDTWKVVKGGNKVYHHKWQFVADDYTGFDVSSSKKRSEVLKSIPEFNENKSRIGNLTYWDVFLNKYGLHK